VPFTISVSFPGVYDFMVDGVKIYTERIPGSSFSYTYSNITAGTHTLSIKRWYSNITASITYIVNRKWRAVETKYDNLGNITSQSIDVVNLANQYTTSVYNQYYGYDNQGRLITVKSGTSLASSVADVTYTYNNADQPSNLKYEYVANANFKNMGYLYNNRGWLTSSNNNHGFSESLDYYKNGNILTQNITNYTYSSSNHSFTYDMYNRLSEVDDITAGTSIETFTYDLDGNFISKVITGNSLKSYIYNYDPGKVNNLLRSVTNGNGNNYSYAYDNRGNVVTDNRSPGVTTITYDQRNLPLTITNTGINFVYGYDDMGNRVTKKGNGNNEYCLRDQTGKELAIFAFGTDNIKLINLYGNGLIGKVDVSWNRYYYLKDHLGSIRTTLSANGPVGEADYYAFGGLKSSSSSLSDDRYKFMAKPPLCGLQTARCGNQLRLFWRTLLR
jgi:YD repeat-containing protein